MSRFLLCLTLVAFTPGCPAPNSAKTEVQREQRAPSEVKEVKEVAEAFFDGLRARDAAAMRPYVVAERQAAFDEEAKAWVSERRARPSFRQRVEDPESGAAEVTWELQVLEAEQDMDKRLETWTLTLKPQADGAWRITGWTKD